MTESHQLLGDYVQTASEEAFRELVTRYLGLVYSAALRLVDGNIHLAQEVSQTVFTDLARQARTLSSEVMLGGWLHRHACFVAANTMRTERRRQARERQAAELQALQAQAPMNFSQIAPLLDAAINDLANRDRTAILLRFFEQRDFRHIGEALESSEDAARVRVNRALEKLAVLLKRRGITSTATALSVVLSTNIVQSAPAGLASAIATAALAGTTLSTSATLAVTKTLVMTSLQKLLLATTLTALAAAGLYEARQASRLRSQVQALQQQEAPWAEQLQRLQREHQDATNRLAGLLEENAQFKSKAGQTELLRLRGEVGQLHQKAGALAALVQQLQNAGPQSTTSYPSNYFPISSLQFAGYATPEATMQSGLWAKSVGNEQAFLESVEPDVAAQLKTNYIQGESSEERSQFLMNQTTNLLGGRILSSTPLGEDEVLLQAEIELLANGSPTRLQVMDILRKTDGQWKLADEFHESGVKPKAP